jgi:hypothetical protein
LSPVKMLKSMMQIANATTLFTRAKIPKDDRKYKARLAADRLA